MGHPRRGLPAPRLTHLRRRHSENIKLSWPRHGRAAQLATSTARLFGICPRPMTQQGPKGLKMTGTGPGESVAVLPTLIHSGSPRPYLLSPGLRLSTSPLPASVPWLPSLSYEPWHEGRDSAHTTW